MKIPAALLRELISNIIDEEIRKVKGGYKVYPKKPQKGRKTRKALSKNPMSYKKALRQLRAVERSKAMNEADPEKGTGKKPKGSGRRLYTDENPKDTVSIKFATVKEAKETIAKVKRIKKPYARKIQILTVLEQRAKVMGKTEIARLAKQAKLQLKKQEGKKT